MLVKREGHKRRSVRMAQVRLHESRDTQGIPQFGRFTVRSVVFQQAPSDSILWRYSLPPKIMNDSIEDPPLFSTQTEATKVAADNGYRLFRGIAMGWLRFGSTTAPCDVFISYTVAGQWLLSIEHAGVARELPESKLSGPGAKTIAVRTLYELHQALDRTYRLSVSLPTVPLVAFEHETADLPRTTEAERLVVMRVGQEIFRKALMDYWNGTCPLTGITDPALLRASHIVPWADCETDSLRLDVYNGFLFVLTMGRCF
jgi:hypothetical protein